MRVIGMAQQGEHNVDRLRHDALAYLEAKELSVPRGVGHPAWASLMLEDAQAGALLSERTIRMRYGRARK